VTEKRPVVVVTGGAGSIGLACARVLGAAIDNCLVLLSDVSKERLDESVQTLSADGIEARAVVTDVSDDTSVAELARAAAKAGALRALVHTAGLSGAMADAARILDVNFVGTLRVLDALEEQVVRGTVGICIASISGHRRFTHTYDPVLLTATPTNGLQLLEGAGATSLHPRAGYAVSKRGILLHVQYRAAAWGRRGGRLVSVSPGLLADTTMGGLVQSTAGESRAYVQRSAAGRAGTTADIARTARFLASEDASYITGSDILVEGGVLAETNHHLDPVPSVRWHATPVAK
jgi:NAD(P)-dependent dehydrogenase (short-subunit alcohol dehydrogenase family)